MAVYHLDGRKTSKFKNPFQDVSVDHVSGPSPVEWADVLSRSSGPVNVRFRIKSIIRHGIMRFQSTVIPISERLSSHQVMCVCFRLSRKWLSVPIMLFLGLVCCLSTSKCFLSRLGFYELLKETKSWDVEISVHEVYKCVLYGLFSWMVMDHMNIEKLRKSDTAPSERSINSGWWKEQK